MNKNSMAKSKVVIIGGGAAGLLAACFLAEDDRLQVTVIEKMDHCAKKLRITGKGRCNVTNSCTRDAFFANLVHGKKFMYSSFSAFNNIDVMQFFEDLGVSLKTERGGRVFPKSDKAQDICQALLNRCKRLGVVFVHDRVDAIEQNAVRCKDKRYAADYILIATGGASYPLTGSTGDGYQLAKSIGHSIVQPAPSLVPIVLKEQYEAREMQGLSLKNVCLKVTDSKNKTVFCEQGEMLFTHFGVSGPLVLSASAHIQQEKEYKLHIDLKPALDEQKLDRRLLREIEAAPNKDMINLCRTLLPASAVMPFLQRCEIAPHQKGAQVRKDQRKKMVQVLKDFCFTFQNFRPIDEAIVTRGGVNTGEVNPATMASKKQSNVYFAGEVLDIDGYTGGFNLQIAWSTAAAAARGICSAIKEEI